MKTKSSNTEETQEFVLGLYDASNVTFENLCAWLGENTKAKESGVKVALSLTDQCVAQIFADNLRAVISDCVDLIFVINMRP